MKKERIRILIADDHALVRQGVRAIISRHPHWLLCGEADNGREAVRLAEQLQPDLAVLDLSMPGLSGMEATRQLLKRSPGTKVLILTMLDSECVAREVLASGAQGYLLKSDAIELLPRAIMALVAGRMFITPQLTWSLQFPESIRRGMRDRHGTRLPGLTAREQSLVRLLAAGKSNKEAAAALNLSVATVQTHRKNIFKKLGVHCAAELVRYAIQMGLAEP